MGCWLWWDISSSCRWAGHFFKSQRTSAGLGTRWTTHFYSWFLQLKLPALFLPTAGQFPYFPGFCKFPLRVCWASKLRDVGIRGASVGRGCCRWWQPSNASSCWSLETMAPGMETRQCGDGGQGSKDWKLVLDMYYINIIKYHQWFSNCKRIKCIFNYTIDRVNCKLKLDDSTSMLELITYPHLTVRIGMLSNECWHACKSTVDKQLSMFT